MLAATRPIEEEIAFDHPEHFFDELEKFQWRVPELHVAGREISRQEPSSTPLRISSQ